MMSARVTSPARICFDDRMGLDGNIKGWYLRGPGVPRDVSEGIYVSGTRVSFPPDSTRAIFYSREQAGELVESGRAKVCDLE